jgi:hypothetical protein
LEVESFLKDLGQDLAFVHFDRSAVAGVDFRKVLDVLNTFLEATHSVDKHTEQRVQRDLPIYVGLSVHVAALVISFLVLGLQGFALSQDLSLHSVTHFDLDFADYAILSLTV